MIVVFRRVLHLLKHDMQRCTVFEDDSNYDAPTDCSLIQMLCSQILKQVSSQTDWKMRQEVSQPQSRFPDLTREQMAVFEKEQKLFKKENDLEDLSHFQQLFIFL